MSRTSIRSLAIAALAGQVLFIAAWVVAGAIEPHYSHARAGISELGASTAAHPWIVNGALVALGLTFVALALALPAVLPRRRASRVALTLFALAGVTIAAAGPLNLDCGLSSPACKDAFDAGRNSWHESAHLWLSLIGQVFIGATPFALARALRPSPAGAAALGCGLFGIAFGLITFPMYDGPGGLPDGLVQRVGLLTVHAWVLIVAVGILWATRAAPKPGRLIPLRPRDFMSGEWSGEGEVVMRPFFIGRHFAGRFRAHRVTRSISETVWLFDDMVDFGDGREMRRRTFLEFGPDGHGRLTASDLPDGAEVWFEAGGYRIAPFRMAFPIGPFPAHVEVVDSSHVEPDGTFVNCYDARALVIGVPLARTTFRVRPVTAEYSRASASDAPPASSAASPAHG